MNETLQKARERNIKDALAEDIGDQDWTALLIDSDRKAHATLIVREQAVLCGRDWFEGCFKALDPAAQFTWSFADGELMAGASQVCKITGVARALLSAERCALNFLQTLSATATQTRAYVQAVSGLSPNPKGCQILDTRKTLPGLRQAQKYAVRVGGGANQRMALWDGILIKENHIAAAGSIGLVMDRAQSLTSTVGIQIEVENLTQLIDALNAGAQSILLDNFSIQEMTQAVKITAGKALLEASGGLGLDDLKQVARTGVDRISVGKLTKDVRAIDYSLRISGLVGKE